MDTLTIKRLLKTYKCFKGVFPSDQLPYNAPLPLNIIVNTDPSTKPGQHWVCVSINSRGLGYYFDSFGLPPLVKDIFDFINARSTEGWSYNKRIIQDVTSITCGNYCVLYIIFKCNDLTIEDFLSEFGHKAIDNDKKMLQVFKNFSFAKKLLKSKHRLKNGLK